MIDETKGDVVGERSENMDRLRDWMQRHAIAEISQQYQSTQGESLRFRPYFKAAANATQQVREACASGIIRKWPVADPPGDDNVRDVVDLALEDVIDMAGHDSWEREEGGGGECTFKPDGSCVLEHYDYFLERVAADYAIDADGAVTKIGGSPEVRELQAMLTEALTTLRDLHGEYFLETVFQRDALHPSVPGIVSRGVALLRKQGVELDLEPKASAPAPGM